MIGGVPTRRTVKRSGRSSPNGCGTCAKNSVSSGNRPRCVSPSFPPPHTEALPSPDPPQQEYPLVLRTGPMQREEEALGGMTFSHNLTARCVVSTGPRFIHRSDAPNTMGRCACSMPPALLTVAPAPSASAVKGMAPSPKNLVGSVLSCIRCR